MKKSYAPVVLGVITLVLFVALAIVFSSQNLEILTPKGTIAAQQRNLIVFATALSMFVILPVFALTFYISWKYRAGNTKAKYRPNWDGSKKLELAWWGIPFAIIFVLSVITWRTSHSLDPFKPLESAKKPLKIQVVALQWRWLFIYPEQGIASVNLVQFPEDTPINFEITADAPMNSFWIPQLGGQIYAMNGMLTKLHLEANDTGDYAGSSANISGKGFASMNFTARASSNVEFDQWVSSVHSSSQPLNWDNYKALAKPSLEHSEILYHLEEDNLQHRIMMQFMSPTNTYKDTITDHELMRDY